MLAPVPEFPTKAPYDTEYIHFVTETRGLLYQYNNTGIWLTTDQGRHWRPWGSLAPQVEAPYGSYIRHFHMLTPELGFAVVHVHEPEEDADAGANPFHESRLLRTSDGGRTWRRVRMPAVFT